jgi:hypothetical protein
MTRAGDDAVGSPPACGGGGTPQLRGDPTHLWGKERRA